MLLFTMSTFVGLHRCSAIPHTSASGRMVFRNDFRQLFERQTLSPGVQALHIMWDILNRGTFVIRGNSVVDAVEDNVFGMGDRHVDAGFVLTLDLGRNPAGETVDNGGELSSFLFSEIPE